MALITYNFSGLNREDLQQILDLIASEIKNLDNPPYEPSDEAYIAALPTPITVTREEHGAFVGFKDAFAVFVHRSAAAEFEKPDPA